MTVVMVKVMVKATVMVMAEAMAIELGMVTGDVHA